MSALGGSGPASTTDEVPKPPRPWRSVAGRIEEPGGSVLEFALILLLGLGLMALLVARTTLLTQDNPDFARPQDLQQYLYMAQHGAFSLHIAPYGWRVGLPFMVSLLPMEPAVGFFVVSFVALWLTAVVVYYLVRQFGMGRGPALIGMIMFLSLSWAVKFNLGDFWLTEPVAFLILSLATLLLGASRPIAASGLMALGSLFRESTLVLAPLFYTLRARRPWDARAALEAVALVLPTIVVMVAIRIAIPALNSDPTYVSTLPAAIQSVVHTAVPTYDLGDTVVRSLTVRLSELRTIPDLFGIAFTLTFSTYGFLVTLMAIAGSVARPDLFARLGLMVLIPYGQLLIATNNERLFVAGFPAVIVLAAAGVVSLTTRFGVTHAQSMALAALFYALNLIDPNAASPRLMLQVGALVASLGFLVVVVWWTRRAARVSELRLGGDDSS